MVRKCANPACSEPFVYFRSGKIYQVDRRDAMRNQVPPDQGPGVEYFWLCGRCASTMRVVLRSDGWVAVAEQPTQPSPLTRENAIPASPSQEHLREDSPIQDRSRAGVHTPRILVLDTELETLGFVEQMLQDAGLGAITSTSTVEAISLLATGFFDAFIAIDRSSQSQAAETLSALATARVHCKSCLCWSAQNLRQRCSDFIEETLQRKPWPDDVHASTAFPLRPEPVAQQITRGTTV